MLPRLIYVASAPVACECVATMHLLPEAKHSHLHLVTICGLVLLVLLGKRIVGVDDGVGSHTINVARLGTVFMVLTSSSMIMVGRTNICREKIYQTGL